MHVAFDKKGFWYALKFLVLVNTIFLSGNFLIQQIYQLQAPFAKNKALQEEVAYQEQEDPVYAKLSAEKPVFLTPKDILKKKQTLVWEKRDFIFADLIDMSLYYYKGGVLQNSFHIEAKGKTGSFFDVPAGYYKIQSKSPNHFSKIANIHLPWTLYLFGNYLIHGWPKQSSGRAVIDTSSGGIRLATENAKILFDESKEEMPVLVYNDTSDNSIDLSYYRKTTLPHQVPEVSAAGALVADVETGQILFEKNKTDNFPIASVSKMMTATIAKEFIKPDEVLSVSYHAATIGGTMVGLGVGEKFYAKDLILTMILPSGNDVATVIKEGLPNFIELMNKKAQAIGMKDTYYKEATGLSQENVSSAEDLYKLLKYTYTSHKDFLDDTSQGTYDATPLNKKKKYTVVNINWPRSDKKFLGGKAGWTSDALETMAGVYGVHLSEYGWRPIAITILGSRHRVQDVRAIINYLEQGFVYGTVANKNQPAPNVEEGADIYGALQIFK